MPMDLNISDEPSCEYSILNTKHYQSKALDVLVTVNLSFLNSKIN